MIYADLKWNNIQVNSLAQGLEQLYEFQKVHPDADIGPFLEKSSQFFQDYIEKGLKSIEKDRVRHGSTTASSLSSPQGKWVTTNSGYPLIRFSTN